MMSDLFCDHINGRDELIDSLSDGALLPAQQVTLWQLIHHLDSQVNFFRLEEVIDYETEVLEEGWSYRESWTCPVCGARNSDIREKESV